MSSATNFVSANLDHVRQHVDQVKYHVVPTLADIGQLVWDDLDEEEVGDDSQFEEESEYEDEEEEEENDEGTKKETNVKPCFSYSFIPVCCKINLFL